MSWLDRANTDFTITCGDGSSYTANWLNAAKQVEYNLSTFEFPNLSGTLVKRRRPKGTRYAIEIIFQGEDHLDTAAAFQASSEDPNPWTITHPFYGTLTVQPVSLSFDNAQYNITRITGTVIETIADSEAAVRTSPEDKIAADKETADTLLAETYATQVQPGTADINAMTANNTAVYNEGVKSLSNTIDSENYINALNTAQTAVNDATAEPLAAMRKTQALINAPVQFAANVRSRIDTLTSQLTQLRNTVAAITTRSQKKLYEGQAGTLIGAQALVTVTNFARTTDYPNRNTVLGVIETLLANYDAYIADLDSLQSINGGDPDFYIPDFDAVFALSALVSYTVGNLFKIAGSSRQERVIYTAEETNAIRLADQLYGIASDDNLQLLRDTNSIGLNELFVIKKDRRIAYYV